MSQQTRPEVVVVEDDDVVRAFFVTILENGGYRCQSFSGGLEALQYLGSCGHKPDVVLSDMNMPGMSGLELLRASRGKDADVPFILVSGSYDVPDALGALGNGATDYLLKPVKAADVLKLVAKHAACRDAGPLARADAERAFSADLSNLADHALPPELFRLLNSLREKRIETLQHSKRVATYAVQTARRLGLQSDAPELQELRLGAMLHDIGKVVIPENVVQKPGPLNPEEWQIMKMHPAIGRELVKSIPGMQGVGAIIYSHHEAFDGSGYPLGLAGGDIPLGARIFAVVDAFDAITSDRPYRAARSMAAAREEIQRGSGTQFDPMIVEPFMKIPEAELELIGRLQADLPVH
jgi:putative nucleotidyltransferase with HDIG domain